MAFLTSVFSVIGATLALVLLAGLIIGLIQAIRYQDFVRVFHCIGRLLGSLAWWCLMSWILLIFFALPGAISHGLPFEDKPLLESQAPVKLESDMNLAERELSYILREAPPIAETPAVPKQKSQNRGWRPILDALNVLALAITLSFISLGREAITAYREIRARLHEKHFGEARGKDGTTTSHGDLTRSGLFGLDVLAEFVGWFMGKILEKIQHVI